MEPKEVRDLLVGAHLYALKAEINAVYHKHLSPVVNTDYQTLIVDHEGNFVIQGPNIASVGIDMDFFTKDYYILDDISKEVLTNGIDQNQGKDDVFRFVWEATDS